MGICLYIRSIKQCNVSVRITIEYIQLLYNMVELNKIDERESPQEA